MAGPISGLTNAIFRTPTVSAYGGGGPGSTGTGAPDDMMSSILADFGLGNLPLGGPADPYAIFAGAVDPSARVGISSSVTGRRPGPPLGGNRQRAPGVPNVSVSYGQVGEVLKKFYQLDPQSLRRMQALLFAGGFYGNVDVTDVPWGVADETSFSAWAQAVARTARMNAAGRDVTYNDVIGGAAEAAGIERTDLEKALSGSNQDLEALLAATVPGDTMVVALSDPNALRSTLDRAASAVLGRKSNSAEQRMFISAMHGLQRDAQITQQKGVKASDITSAGRMGSATAAGIGNQTAPPGDQVVEYSMPDIDANAEATVRAENPGEAGAHDIALQVANLLELLKAPVNVPRITAG